MKYNIKDVERYILLGNTYKKNRPIEKNILYSGHWSCFWAVIIWVLFHIVSIFGDYPMRVFPINISIIILIPVVILFAIKFCKSGLNDFTNRSHKEISPYISLFSVIGAIGGITFTRFFFSNISYSASMIVLSMIFVFLILILILSSCISYYKVYLIRKYCPYLKNRCR